MGREQKREPESKINRLAYPSVEVMCSSLTPVCMQIWQELPAHRRVEEGEDRARKTATAMALWKRMTYLYPRWQPSSSRLNWPQRLKQGSLRFGHTRHPCYLHPFVVPMCGSNERKEMKRAPTCGSNEKKRTIYICCRKMNADLVFCGA